MLGVVGRARAVDAPERAERCGVAGASGRDRVVITLTAAVEDTEGDHLARAGARDRTRDRGDHRARGGEVRVGEHERAARGELDVGGAVEQRAEPVGAEAGALGGVVGLPFAGDHGSTMEYPRVDLDQQKRGHDAREVLPLPLRAMPGMLPSVDETKTLLDVDLPARGPSPEPPSAGECLGPYAVTGHLGAGGMGAVLQVRDPSLEREMAAKVTLDPVQGPNLDRFIREAQITGRLEHPGIPPVHALGLTTDGRAFFTMKQVRGRDLAAIVATLRLGAPTDGDPPTGSTLLERLEIFLKITDAVAFAHSQGVIHRDLKPANVMVGPFGEVLVMDWGLARVKGEPLGGGPDGQRPGAASTATQDGTVVGTPAYMAPEQARGCVSELDERADLYALGALLYELLTLVPPYEGATVWHVLDQVLAGPPVSPCARAPHRAIPWELEAVVLRAMAHDPCDRYPSAAALRADVVAYLEGRRVGAARYGVLAALRTWARTHRQGLVASALALASGALVLGGVAWQRHRAIAALVDRAARHHVAQEVEAAVEATDQALALAPGHTRALALRAAVLAAAADRALVGVAGPDALERAWRARLAAVANGEPERPESAESQALREQQVERYLAAAAWLDRATAPVSEDLASRRIKAGTGLAWAALLGRDYIVARQAAGALSLRGEPGRRVASVLEDAVRMDRAARVELWCRRVGIAAQDLADGLGREGRPPGAPLRDDYLLELAGYRHPEVALELGRWIESHLVARALGSEAARPWSQAERDLAHVLVHALGRLQLPESVPPLARWLVAVTDSALAVEAGLALCNSRQAAAHPVLLATRDRWGINSGPWSQIARAFARVPEPARDASDEPRSAQDFMRRGNVRKDKRDLEGARADYDRAIELDATSAGAFNNRGLVRHALGDVDGALADYDRAVELDGRYAMALSNRGLARQAKGDLDGALADYEQAIELDPSFSQAINNRGSARNAEGDVDGALADYDRAIELDPENARAFCNRGNARGAKGDVDGALADYDQAIAKDPQYARAFVNRGCARQIKGDLDGALADFDQAIAKDPRDAQAFRQRGIARHARRDLDRALADYDQAIALDPDLAVAIYDRALVHEARGEPDRALADYDQAIAKDPSFAKALHNRAVIREARGDLEGALTDYDRAIAADPRFGLALCNRAVARQAKGDLPGALADLDQAVELDPRDALALHNRGVARQKSGDLAGARADLDRAIELDPSDEAFTNRGIVREASGDRAGALTDYDRAIELAPRSVLALLHRGIVRRALSDPSGALQDFDRAIELDPRSWHAWANRGFALANTPRRDEAIAALARAVELAPPADRRRLEPTLRRLRGD